MKGMKILIEAVVLAAAGAAAARTAPPSRREEEIMEKTPYITESDGVMKVRKKTSRKHSAIETA